MNRDGNTINMKSTGLSKDEKMALQERTKELKAEARLNKSKSDGKNDVLAKIAEMPEPERAMASRLHALITTSAPELAARTWYGMPAYAKHGKVICFFQSAHKFNTKYATLGFSDSANLNDGNMWPTAFALKELTATEETQIVALVKKAVS